MKISIQITFLSVCPNFVNISSQSVSPPPVHHTIFSILDIYTHIGIAIYVFFLSVIVQIFQNCLILESNRIVGKS